MDDGISHPKPERVEAHETVRPEQGAARAALERQLSELSLPFMWSLRQEAVRAFEPLDMRPTRVLLLELIAHGMTHPKELADMLDTQPPAISNMLADLEGRGVIRRSQDPDDGRRIRLALTVEGEAMLQEIRRRWLEFSHAKLSVLSDDELRDLVDIYRKLLRHGEGS